MLWGCFNFNGLGKLVSVNGIMNRDQYIDILSKDLVPFIKTQYPNEDGIFQQDLSHIK